MSTQERYYLSVLNSLEGFFSAELLEAFDRLLLAQSTLNSESYAIAELLHADRAEVDKMLNRLVNEGFLGTITLLRCSRCEEEISKADIEADHCPFCGVNVKTDAEWRAVIHYTYSRARNRDIGWLIAVHGMNTLGPWQEELQWLIDQTFPTTIPFRNMKYGRVLWSPMVPALQRRKLRNFQTRLEAYLRNLPSQLQGVKPDVIAHSFGTWLVANALLENPDLRLGRIILLGSIVPPDFDWDVLRARGQLESVLNHYGTRDRWVGKAQYFIPGSGPSGLKGFLSSGSHMIYNVAESIDHSDFFTIDLQRRFNSVWQPFLQGTIDLLSAKIELHADCESWKPPRRLLRAPFPTAILIGAVAVLLSLPMRAAERSRVPPAGQ